MQLTDITNNTATNQESIFKSAAKTAEPARGFPLSPDEVTTDFLTKCLGAPVTSFALDTSMTADGVLADAFRVHSIEYGSGEGPPSCFMKCTKGIPQVVALCQQTDVYKKEVYFYEHLIDKVKDAINVPKCYGIFRDQAKDDCSEFCLVLEDFQPDQWRAFNQETNVMSLEDTRIFFDDLASLHAATWGEPVDEDTPGLGTYRPHWQSLNDGYWLDDQGTTMFDALQPKWLEVYGAPLLGLVSEEVAATTTRIAEIFKGEHGRRIQDALLTELQTRPRAISHGDARGNNLFKPLGGGRFSSGVAHGTGFIDWQMWAAGTPANEMPQVWLNSWPMESGTIQRFDELMGGYYATLCRKCAERGVSIDATAQYPLETLKADTKLLFVDMWIQYIGFSLGSLDGYKDPSKAKSKDNWKLLITRNMETLHHSGALDALEDFISTLDL